MTDDGLPNPPGVTATTWSQISGPATVSIDDSANVDTWVTFPSAGTYVLHLEADDGDLSAADEVTIIVSPGAANRAPSVDAGTDLALTLPEDGIFLEGSIADDGLPDPPGATTAVWSQTSGPGAAIIEDAANIETWVSFSEPGTYVLHLKVDDGDLTANDEVTITVNAAPASADSGPYLETGIVPNIDNSDWTTVALDRFYTSMVVVCTPNYDGTSPPVIVRIDEADGNSFRIRADRTDGSTAIIDPITIHYMVVEQGVYTEADHGVKMEAVKFYPPSRMKTIPGWARVCPTAIHMRTLSYWVR